MLLLESSVIFLENGDLILLIVKSTHLNLFIFHLVKVSLWFVEVVLLGKIKSVGKK